MSGFQHLPRCLRASMCPEGGPCTSFISLIELDELLQSLRTVGPIGFLQTFLSIMRDPCPWDQLICGCSSSRPKHVAGSCTCCLDSSPYSPMALCIFADEPPNTFTCAQVLPSTLQSRHDVANPYSEPGPTPQAFELSIEDVLMFCVGLDFRCDDL